MNKKVMVGMSGGVDSSVAAAILKNEGYEVIGVTMQIWPDKEEENIFTDGGCCSISAVDDARRIADRLDIPYYVLNFKDVFNKTVIEYFKKEYLEGKTPNPCIACNRYVKFDDMLRRANSMGIDYISTGHYAKIEYNTLNGLYSLRKSDDSKKDQTYALYNLNQDQLSKILMPLGVYKKTKVREIARELGFEVANKKDSQEICFIEDNDYAKFIKNNTNKKIIPGDFVDVNGNYLGKHEGIIHYTIGQRKGLGITFGKPMYVVGINCDNNQVVLGDNNQAFRDTVIASDINIISGEKIDKKKIKAKIRYSAKESEAEAFYIDDDKVKIQFDIPQRAVTPGQSIVFYNDDEVLGGGIIEREQGKIKKMWK